MTNILVFLRFLFFFTWGIVALQYIIFYMCCDFRWFLSKIFAFIALNVTVILGQCFSGQIESPNKLELSIPLKERSVLLSQIASTGQAYDPFFFFFTDGASQVHFTALKTFSKLPYGLTRVTVSEKNVSMLILFKHYRREITVNYLI